MTTAQRRLAYYEQNHAAASKIRTEEIKQMILTSQELDLAFLVDATGSMQVCNAVYFYLNVNCVRLTLFASNLLHLVWSPRFL